MPFGAIGGIVAGAAGALGTAGTAAAIGAAGSLASAGIGALASGSAGSKQSAAANQASQQALQQWQFTAAQESPFVNAGTAAISRLQKTMPDYSNWYSQYFNQAAAENNALQLSLPGAFTQQQLESTPGYQFTRDQGLKSVQNAAAAKGLGISGAALKGAATFATGLADSTYSTRFNEQQQLFNDKNAKVANLMNLGVADTNQYGANYNRLMGVANMGQNAVTQTGNQGAYATNNAGNFLTSGAQSAAAGTIGTANALAGGIGGLAGNVGGGLLLQNFLDQQAAQQSAGGVMAPVNLMLPNGGMGGRY